VVVADLDLLPEPESRNQVPDWAIRVSIAILYFLIGLGKFSSSPGSHWVTWKCGERLTDSQPTNVLAAGNLAHRRHTMFGRSPDFLIARHPAIVRNMQLGVLSSVSEPDCAAIGLVKVKRG
jgi:hypothetical protein